MRFELLLVLALAASATFLIIVISIGLIVHKSIHGKRTQRRQLLYSEYSQVITDLILRELPSTEEGREGAMFGQYDELMGPLKERLEAMTTRKRSLHREALKLAIIDFAKDVSGETSDRLVYFSYALAFVDEEIKSLHSRHWWVRAQAVHDLGLLRARRAITPLTEALEDSHLDVRIQAMQSLVVLGGVQSLRSILGRSKNISQWAAIELSIIVMTYKEDAIPYLVEALGSSDQSVVLFCIEMLAEIGFVTAVEPLRQMASDYPNTVIRAKAVEALGRLGDERAEEMLIGLLKNPMPNLRLKAIEAIGKIGIPAAVPVLAERLREGSLDEKILAARSIASTGPEGISFLHSLADVENSLVRDVAYQILEEFGSNAATTS
ncbi:MAG: HEAT repeat domain-containing protein [Bacteroidota bacterium]